MQRIISEQKIKPADFDRVISQLLTTYGANVVEGTEEASKRTAKELAKELRTARGKNGGFKRGEKMMQGWDSKRTQTRRLGGIYTVYNKTVPGLPHLLEFGHAIRGGGRKKPTSTAFEFIAPIADTAEEKFRDAFVDVMDEMT